MSVWLVCTTIVTLTCVTSSTCYLHEEFDPDRYHKMFPDTVYPEDTGYIRPSEWVYIADLVWLCLVGMLYCTSKRGKTDECELSTE
jgi:hypothetical protein